jgi:hypothetical protein
VNRTFDLVVSGSDGAALAAAVDALLCGRRVLAVLRSGDASLGRRFRRSLRKAANAAHDRATVLTNAEVVCVAGVNGVEAVVVRYLRTGRLFAVNASAFLSCDAWPGG